VGQEDRHRVRSETIGKLAEDRRQNGWARRRGRLLPSGKNQHKVRKLIAGPTVFIRHDERVELCMDIIREENNSSLVKSRDDIQTPRE